MSAAFGNAGVVTSGHGCTWRAQSRRRRYSFWIRPVMLLLRLLMPLLRLLSVPLLSDWIWLIGTFCPLTVSVGGFWLMLTAVTTPCT